MVPKLYATGEAVQQAIRRSSDGNSRMSCSRAAPTGFYPISNLLPEFRIALKPHFKEVLVINNRLVTTLFILAVFTLGFLLGKIGSQQLATSADAQTKSRVFEIRTYTTEEGKLDALQARFRSHT